MGNFAYLSNSMYFSAIKEISPIWKLEEEAKEEMERSNKLFNVESPALEKNIHDKFISIFENTDSYYFGLVKLSKSSTLCTALRITILTPACILWNLAKAVGYIAYTVLTFPLSLPIFSLALPFLRPIFPIFVLTSLLPLMTPSSDLFKSTILNSQRSVDAFKESYGYCMSFFNLKEGLYYAQKHQFLRASRSKKQEDNEQMFTHLKKLSLYMELRTTNLLEFYNMNPSEKKEIIEKFKLQKQVAILGKNFDEKLATIPQSALKNMTLEVLQLEYDKSHLKYWLMDAEDFKKITLRDLSFLDINICHTIRDRYHFMKKPSDEMPGADQDFFNRSILQVSKIPVQEINAHIKDLSPGALYFLSSEQIPDLDLTNMSDFQLRVLGHDPSDFYPVLTSGQVSLIFDRLEYYHRSFSFKDRECSHSEGKSLSFLSINQCKELDFSRLSSNQVFFLISGRSTSTQDEAQVEAKERIEALSEEQVRKIFFKMKDPHKTLVKESLRTELENKRKEISQRYAGKNGKANFAKLSVEKVQCLLDEDLLDECCIKCVSPQQLVGLKFNNLSPCRLESLLCMGEQEADIRQSKISLLTTKQLQFVFPWYADFWFAMDPKTRQNLDVELFSKGTVASLFQEFNDLHDAENAWKIKEKNCQVMASFSSKQLEQLRNKMSPSNRSLADRLMKTNF